MVGVAFIFVLLCFWLKHTSWPNVIPIVLALILPADPWGLHRRQSTLPGQHSSAAASSDHNPRLAPTPGSWPPSQYLPHATEPGDVTTNANHYGYTADTLPVPLPSRAQSYPQGETSPLQTTGGENAIWFCILTSSKRLLHLIRRLLISWW